MPLGQVLYESGVAMTHAYFPTRSIVSLLYVMEGRITLLDRPGLERRTCECHAVVRREYERLPALGALL